MKFVAVPDKKTFCAGLASLVIIGIPSVSLGVTVEQVPNPRQTNGGWVTDMADILSPNAEAELNQTIANLEAKNGSEIAVVTVPETAPSATTKQFATTLFNRWGIGKADKNNGVLVLISQSDRRVEIETGYGLQAILPNAKVSDIIQQEMTPKFKQGDYNGGTIAGTKSLVLALETSNQLDDDDMPWYIFPGAFGGGIVVFWLLLRHRKNKQTKSPSVSSNSSQQSKNKHSKSGSVSSNSSPQISNDSDLSYQIVSNNNTASSNSSDTASSGNSNNSYDSGSSYSSSSSTSSYDSGSSSSSSTSSYDSGSSSSSSSGSDFGGGSSGGDGAGGSW